MSSSTIATHSVLAFKTPLFRAMLSGSPIMIIVCPAQGIRPITASKLPFGSFIVGITKSTFVFDSEHNGIEHNAFFSVK
jgi:hypothetical protein